MTYGPSLFTRAAVCLVAFQALVSAQGSAAKTQKPTAKVVTRAVDPLVEARRTLASLRFDYE